MIAAHVNHVQPVCTFLSRTVMLILIFNSTAYWHAHSFILYILYSVLYILFLFILFYAYFPCVVFTIFALSMERTWLTFHCWLYNPCIVVYVTNKTWTWTWTWYQVICNVSACLTLFGHQVVLWANEASRNEHFCEPLGWKASVLHKASSRHHYLNKWWRQCTKANYSHTRWHNHGRDWGCIRKLKISAFGGHIPR